MAHSLASLADRCPLVQSYDNIVEHVFEPPADIHVSDGHLETPLHRAAWKGRLGTVKTHLSEGADINIIAGPFETTVLQNVICQPNTSLELFSICCLLERTPM